MYTQIGPTGSQGLQGPQGNQGDQGPQGNQGFQGVTGSQGNQGPQGFQGNQGFQGPQGFQGDQGFQGTQGFQGNQGFQGTQGFQGNQGPQGFQGNQGNQGFQGYQGPTGPGLSILSPNTYSLLTSDGTPSGVNVETNLTFNGSLLNLTGDLQLNSTVLGTSSEVLVRESSGIIKYRKGIFSDPNIIRVNKEGGDFTSIKEAVDSITSSSAINRYSIQVGPGEFFEDEIDLTSKPYVSIVGSDILSTVVVASGSAQNIFRVGNTSEISFMTIRGVGGNTAFYADNIGGFSLIHKISIYDCSTNIFVNSTTQDTQFYGEYIDFNGDYQYGAYIYSSGGYTSYVNLENYYNYPTVTGSVTTWISGQLSEVYVLASSHTGFGSDIGFYLEDGAQLNMSSTNIEGYDIGIKVANVGTASFFDIDATSITESTTWNMLVEHPNTRGTYQGSNEHQKISNASQNVYWGFLDSTDGEFDVTRKLSVTFADNTHTDLSTLIFEGEGMGVLSGGSISLTTGLTVSVSGGYGYLEKSNGVITRIDWNTTLVDITDNTSKYIYINESSIFSISSSLPDIESNILIGRAIASNGQVIIIDNTRARSKHLGNKLNLLNRKALGPIYETGSLVTTAGNFGLNVSNGSYYFGETNFTPSGGGTISFSQFYRNGSGGWIITPTSSVTTNYDLNGSLGGMSASYFTKHTLYVVGESVDEKYLLVVGQTQYPSLVQTENAGLPTPPSYFEDGIVPIANIYIQQGTLSILQIEDIRPVIGFKSSGVNATSLHSNLLGLSSDDHKQYLLVDGARPMSGNLVMGSNSITGVNLINSVDITSHASRHLPNGSDPLATGIPSTIGLTNSEGIQNSFARRDHIHDHGSQPGGSLHAIATTASAGFLSSVDKLKIDNLPTTYLSLTGGTVSGTISVENLNISTLTGSVRSLYIDTLGNVGATALGGGSSNYYVQDTAPTASNNGDRWYDLTTGLEYVWINDGDSYQWVAPASTGPQGTTGPAGSVGATGSQGPTGSNGVQGATGPQGATGSKGATGSSGITVGSFGLTIDGGSSVITSGGKGYVSMPYGGTITGWDMLGNTTGSIQVDLKKANFSSFPTTTSVTGGNYIGMTTSIKGTDSTLSGWSATFSQGDIYEFKVVTISSLNRVNIVLRTNKTS
jgi:hypothetical protein